MGRHKTNDFELYEKEMIELASKGLTIGEISQVLKPLKYGTVDKYMRQIKDKWGAKNITNLIHLWHLKKASK